MVWTRKHEIDILSSFHSNLFEIFEGHIITNNGIISSASALGEAFDDANDRINLCERTFSFFSGNDICHSFSNSKDDSGIQMWSDLESCSNLFTTCFCKLMLESSTKQLLQTEGIV